MATTDHDQEDGHVTDEQVDPTVWTTHVDDQEVRLPSSIAEVRAALPEERRAEFDRELQDVPGPRLTLWLAMRALETVEGAIEEDDRVLARLRAGDYSGVTFLDDDEVA